MQTRKNRKNKTFNRKNRKNKTFNRKNRKNKTFNLKNRGGGPKSKKKQPEFNEFSSPKSPKDFLSTTFFITKDIINNHKALKDFHSFLSDLKYKKYKYTQNEKIIQIINEGIEFYNAAKTNNKTEEVITKNKTLIIEAIEKALNKEAEAKKEEERIREEKIRREEERIREERRRKEEERRRKEEERIRKEEERIREERRRKEEERRRKEEERIRKEEERIRKEEERIREESIKKAAEIEELKKEKAATEKAASPNKVSEKVVSKKTASSKSAIKTQEEIIKEMKKKQKEEDEKERKKLIENRIKLSRTLANAKIAQQKEQEKKEASAAATKIQSMVRGKTARKKYEREKAKESAERKKSEVLKKTFEKIIDKTPQEITSEEWSTFFEENVNQIKNTIKDTIKDINKIIEKNETNGFREYYPNEGAKYYPNEGAKYYPNEGAKYYQNEGAKYYSHVIFFILGFLTPLLEKKDVTMYLKGGQAIHLNRHDIKNMNIMDYQSNDIDIDFIIKDDSSFKKRDVCYMIRNFIYWCVSDDYNIGDTVITKVYTSNTKVMTSFVSTKNLSSIESINVVKISYPYKGQMFALMDMSFKDTVSDLNKLFTPKYIQHKEFKINGITHKYNYQSVLSLILEKIFILLHANDPNIDIATKQVIFNKFIATLQYTLQLYIITQTENTTEKISTEYSKLFNVDKKAIQEFINDVLYPGEREQQNQQERELERQKQELEREQNRELESLVATLSKNINTFKDNHKNLFNNLSNNIKSIENVNVKIQNLLEKNKIQPTLEDKMKYILDELRPNVVKYINEYLNNNDSLNYLKNKKINLIKVRDEWNDITDIYKYKSLSQEIPSDSFQGMSPLREPTYKYLY
jgi:hypothetical protein